MNSTLQTPAGNSLSGPLAGKRAFRVSGLLLFVMGSALLIMLLSFWSYNGRFWGNWYPLIISSSQADEELELFLSNLCEGEIVSESNSLLEYNGYGEPETLRVKELGTGNAPYVDDPRIDPYMTGNPYYFNQGKYKILYLPANASPLYYSNQLRNSSLVSEGEWMLADASFAYLPAFLFVLVILFLCVGCLRFCIPAIGFLSLGFFVFSSGDSHLLLLLLLAALPVRYMMDGANSIFWAMFLLPLVLGRVSSVLDLHLAAALSSLGCLSLGVNLALPHRGRSLSGRSVKSARKKAGHDHVLFEPVSLTAPLRVEDRSKGDRFAAGAVSVLSLLLLLSSMAEEIHLPAGIPAAESSGLSWDFESLSLAEENPEFPGVADYVRHRAYQDSFMHGGDYSLPRPGSVLSVDDFVMEEGTIINRPRVVFSFDDRWFGSTLAGMSGSGPGRLMSGEESIPGIVRKNSLVFGNSIGIMLFAGLCLLLNLYIRIFGMHPDRPVRSDLFSGKFVLRRKQQAA